MKLLPPSKLLVEVGTSGNGFKISWEKSFLAVKYIVYYSYVPYGTGDKIGETTDTTFSCSPLYREGLINWFRVEAVSNTQTESTFFVCIKDNKGYINFNEGTWIDTPEGVKDPNKNKFFPSNVERSKNRTYKDGSVNPLPSNVLRRYQLNKISRDEPWVLDAVGEPVFFFKLVGAEHSVTEQDPNIASTYRADPSNVNSTYFGPIPIIAKITPFNDGATQNQEGLRYKGIANSSWAMAYINISDYDVLVTASNEMFVVTNVQNKRSWGGKKNWVSWDSVMVQPGDTLRSHPAFQNLDFNYLNSVR